MKPTDVSIYSAVKPDPLGDHGQAFMTETTPRNWVLSSRQHKIDTAVNKIKSVTGIDPTGAEFDAELIKAVAVSQRKTAKLIDSTIQKLSSIG